MSNKIYTLELMRVAPNLVSVKISVAFFIRNVLVLVLRRSGAPSRRGYHTQYVRIRRVTSRCVSLHTFLVPRDCVACIFAQRRPMGGWGIKKTGASREVGHTLDQKMTEMTGPP